MPEFWSEELSVLDSRLAAGLKGYSTGQWQALSAQLLVVLLDPISFAL